MDPAACLERLRDCIAANDWEEAGHAAEDLAQWLSRGGFPPAGFENQAITLKGACLRLSQGARSMRSAINVISPAEARS